MQHCIGHYMYRICNYVAASYLICMILEIDNIYVIHLKCETEIEFAVSHKMFDGMKQQLRIVFLTLFYSVPHIFHATESVNVATNELLSIDNKRQATSIMYLL